MRRHSSSSMLMLTLLFFAVVATARKVSPFFNKHEEGIAVEMDAVGNLQRLKDMRDSAMLVDRRRRLSVGDHPNLPGGGANVGGGGGSDGDEDSIGDGDGDGDSEGGGGNGYLGKGGKGKGGKGKLSKKSSKKSGKGKGGKGKSSSSSSKGKGKGDSGGNYGGGDGDGGSGGDGGGGSTGDDDDDDDDNSGTGGTTPPTEDNGFTGVDPPEPCKCTPDFCDCEEGELATDYEFVLVRDEIGSDTPTEAEFGVASGIGLNGQVYNMVYTTAGRDFGGDPIGLFKGFCTVVSDLNGELLCTYEIYIYANGDTGLGGIIVTGPVTGLETGREFESIVTGAEFDFSVFNTGFLTTVQDSQKPILFAFLSLYV